MSALQGIYKGLAVASVAVTAGCATIGQDKDDSARTVESVIQAEELQHISDMRVIGSAERITKQEQRAKVTGLYQNRGALFDESFDYQAGGSCVREAVLDSWRASAGVNMLNSDLVKLDVHVDGEASGFSLIDSWEAGMVSLQESVSDYEAIERENPIAVNGTTLEELYDHCGVVVKSATPAPAPAFE